MAATMKVPTEFTAVNKFSHVIKTMTADTKAFTKNAADGFDRMNSKIDKFINTSALAAAGITAPLIYAGKKAMDFEDRMADVAKTTGLSGKSLKDFGNDILDMATKTRSSIDDLAAIAEIGGRLGIEKDELKAFTQEANKFAVALGGDYANGVDGAINSVGKLNSLFSDTKKLNPAESLNISGSMINALTNMGVKAENINDFALRVGRLPEALKPSLQSTLALGAMFEKLGVNAEVASSGFSNLIIRSSQNMPAFAKQMGISAKEASELLKQDPVLFASRFAKSFEGMGAEKMSLRLKSLKLNSNEVIGAVGALASGQDVLTKSMLLANNQYEKATSLTDEYNVKNNTAAAQWQKLKNNLEVFVLIIGNELLPIVSKYIPKIIEVTKGVSNWIKENTWLVSTAVMVASSLWLVSGAIQSVKTIMTVAKVVMGAYTAITAAYSAVAVTAALTGASFAAVIWTTLAPILAVIAAIAAIIAIIYYWDEICSWFGKQWEKFTNLVGTTWDALTGWFGDFSFKEFFMSIGQSIIDFLLLPLKSVLKLVSMIPGSIGEAAGKGLDFVNDFSNLSGLSVEKVEKLEAPEVISATNNQNNRINGRLDVNFNDPNNNVSSVANNSTSFVPINITSTQNF